MCRFLKGVWRKVLSVNASLLNLMEGPGRGMKMILINGALPWQWVNKELGLYLNPAKPEI